MLIIVIHSIMTMVKETGTKKRIKFFLSFSPEIICWLFQSNEKYKTRLLTMMIITLSISWFSVCVCFDYLYIEYFFKRLWQYPKCRNSFFRCFVFFLVFFFVSKFSLKNFLKNVSNFWFSKSFSCHTFANLYVYIYPINDTYIWSLENWISWNILEMFTYWWTAKPLGCRLLSNYGRNGFVLLMMGKKFVFCICKLINFYLKKSNKIKVFNLH